MKLVYPAILTPCIEKEGYTIEMGKDAACGWIIDELGNGNNVPQQLFPFKEPELINSKKSLVYLY